MAADLAPVENYVETLRVVKIEQAKLKEVENAAKEAIMGVLGDEEEGHIDGRLVLTNRHKEVTRVDPAKVREILPSGLVELVTVTKTERAGIRLVD